MLGMTTFTLDTAPGIHRLIVDGVDVSDSVRAVTIESSPLEVPQVTIYATAPGTITGDGVVTVVADPRPVDLLAAVAAWVESIDTPTLIAMVESQWQSPTQSPIAVTQQVLAALAREALDG